MVGTGMLDDMFELPPKPKLLMQLIAAMIMVFYGEFVIDSKACVKIAKLARKVRDTPHRAYGVLAPYRPAWWHFLFCRRITSLKSER